MAVKAHHFGKRKTSFGTSMHEITLFRIVKTRPGLYLLQLHVLDMYRPEREFPPLSSKDKQTLWHISSVVNPMFCAFWITLIYIMVVISFVPNLTFILFRKTEKARKTTEKQRYTALDGKSEFLLHFNLVCNWELVGFTEREIRRFWLVVFKLWFKLFIQQTIILKLSYFKELTF